MVSKNRKQLDEAIGRLILGHFPTGVLVTDGDGRICACNAAMERIFGHTAEALIGRHRSRLFPGPAGGWQGAIDTGERTRAPRQVMGSRADGSEVRVDLTSAEFEIGGARHIVDFASDLDARHSNRLFRAMLEIRRAMHKLTDHDDLMQEVCQLTVESGVFAVAWLAMVDRSTDRVDAIASWAAPDGLVAALTAANEAERDGNEHGPIEASLQTGRSILSVDATVDPLMVRWAAPLTEHGLRATVVLPLLVAGRQIGVLVLHCTETRHFTELELELLDSLTSDLAYALDFIAAESRRKQVEAVMHYMAGHDALTGLPNRTLFRDRVDHALARCREDGGIVGLVFLDLDRFNSINDTLGHTFGDRVLREVADRLREISPDPDLVGRLAGDDFGIIIEGCEDADEIDSVVRRMRRSLASPFRVDGHPVALTASMGVAVFPQDGDNVDRLIRNTDTALYRARARGFNDYAFYTSDMNDQAVERLSLETQLRQALQQREFRVFYQPKVSLATGAIVGAEALVRWLHPEIGSIAPSRFVPMLEETGLIGPVSDWILHTACSQAREWNELGLQPLDVAVNISPLQFRNLELASSIGWIVADAGLDPKRLELELTESLIMEDMDASIELLNELKSLGVKVAIDDFGTGYSSFTYLKRFPIDSIKIDQSFVRTIPESRDDSAIVAAILAMAHNMCLTTVAEGVETEEQVRFLRARGCDMLQGYIFSEPLEQAEFAELLRSGRTMKFDG